MYINFLQPFYLVKAVKANKPSCIASKRTNRRRAQNASSLRSFTSVQLSTELARLPHNEKIEVCARAGVKNRASVSRKFGLAIKSNLNLSWTAYRKQKR